MKNGKLLLILALILCLGASCIAGLLPAPAEASMPIDHAQQYEDRMQWIIFGEHGPELEKYRNKDVHENSPIPSECGSQIFASICPVLSCRIRFS